MTSDASIDTQDEPVDAEIQLCLSLDEPKSFFLFAGAGSGKTRSLILALDHLRLTAGPRLRLRGQRIAVVTYTIAARNEIVRRTQFDPLIEVSTIHSFAWSLISGFTHDIREWLRVRLKSDISDLEEQQRKGRASKASVNRALKLESKRRRLQDLDSIRRFVYSPDTDNRGRDSLNHAEVLQMAGTFVREKPALRNILKDGHPFILVDESQDTNRHIVDALFTFQAAHQGKVAVGLFGDMMQRIYGDGDPELGKHLPPDWATPTKKLNFRCPRRVIKLINKLRESTDGKRQTPCSSAAEGHVRLFILPSGSSKTQAEMAVCASMATLTGDSGWTDEDGVKVLILEHHMAALRMGFADLFGALYPVSRYRTALLDGSLTLVTFFSKLIVPLHDVRHDAFALARLVRDASPLASAAALKSAVSEAEQLARAEAAVCSLMSLLDANIPPTFRAVAENVAGSGLFEMPDTLQVALKRTDASDLDADLDDEEEGSSERDKAVVAFLDCSFDQVRPYARYVEGKARFDTHQGVKGLEFPRVMVVMDDQEARGFQFKYEKLFSSDPGDASADATRRLFYVTCSRAERSLALVAYTNDAERVRSQVLAQGWFQPDEIQLGAP